MINDDEVSIPSLSSILIAVLSWVSFVFWEKLRLDNFVSRYILTFRGVLLIIPYQTENLLINLLILLDSCVSFFTFNDPITLLLRKGTNLKAKIWCRYNFWWFSKLKFKILLVLSMIFWAHFLCFKPYCNHTCVSWSQ